MAGLTSRFKFNLALCCGIAFLVVVGEATEVSIQNQKEMRNALGTHSQLTIYEDDVTGCQYVGTLNGLAVRLDTKGQPMCGK